MLEISDSVAGNTIAAPRPMKQRATISWAGRCGQAAGDARQAEDADPRERRALATDAVGLRLPLTEQQGREHEVVRVDNPLQLAVGGVQFAHQRRQRDVDDRRVEVDHEGRHQKCRQERGTSRAIDVLINSQDKK